MERNKMKVMMGLASLVWYENKIMDMCNAQVNKVDNVQVNKVNNV